MFGISGEHLLVLLVILLIFGPKRLPDLGHSLGRTMKNFKDAMAGKADEVRPMDSPSPAPKAPSAIAAGSEPSASAAGVEEKQKNPTSV